MPARPMKVSRLAPMAAPSIIKPMIDVPLPELTKILLTKSRPAALANAVLLCGVAVWVVIEEVKPADWYAAGKPGEPIKK